MKKSLVLVLPLLVALSVNAATKKKTQKVHGFFQGQIPPAKFEYPDLAGVYTPPEAQQICEEDLQCAGFTYKGAKGLTDQHFFVSFFRFVSEASFKGDAVTPATFHWTSYRVKRGFVIVPGEVPPQVKGSTTAKPDLKEAAKLAKAINTDDTEVIEKFKWKLSSPIMSLDLFDNAKLELHQTIDFSQIRFTDKTRRVVAVQLAASGDAVTDSQQGSTVDNCCKSGGDSFDSAAVTTALTAVAREPCSLGKIPFVKRFVIPREPLLLTACSATCATLNWTVWDVVNTFAGQTDAKWSVEADDIKKTSDIKEILSVLESNPDRQLHVQGGFSPSAGQRLNKFVLDHEEPKFGPGTGDLFMDFTSGGTWRKNINWWKKGYVGVTNVNQVPDLKITLVTGHQLWVLTPFTPIKGSPYHCSASCSKAEEIGKAWFLEVAPQLGAVTYLGRKTRHAVLKPGDTLYLPQDWVGHFYNIEDSVMLRDSELNSENLDDVAFRFGGPDLNAMKKFLYSRDDKRKETRRFDAALKQVAKGRSAAKNKPKAKK